MAVNSRRLGRPPQTDSAQTRARILSIARRVYADLGYEAATNKNVADEAAITTGALYHYFPSKRELYLAVHDDVQAEVYRQFQSAVQRPGSFLGKMEAVLDAAHRMNRSDPTLARFLATVRVDMARHPDLREVMSEAAAARQRFFGSIVDAGVASGEIRAVDRDKVSAFVLTALIGLLDPMISGDPKLHRRAIAGVMGVLEGTLVRPLPPA